MKNVLLLLLLLFCTSVQASIDFTKDSESLIKESKIFIDSDAKSFQQMLYEAKFVSPSKKSINLGFVREKTLWIRLDFKNSTAQSVEKILQVKNPLLESVVLYDANGSVTKKGTLNLVAPREALHSAFLLRLKPYEKRLTYLKVQTQTTALRLDIALKDKINYIKSEYQEETLIFVFLTTIFFMLFYNLVLYFYTKERVYIYYVLYLFSLICQQSTYLGITQMFFPAWFIHYDNLSVVLKVNLMYITAILFAKSFLHSYQHPKINKIYNLILLFALIEIPLFGTSWFYVPEVAIVTALIFIYFNMYAGIVIYKKGYVQARLFVLGWAFQLVGFTLMIVDGLGLISVMSNLPELIMLLTLLEAIILSLAFVDRYAIYKKEKDISDLKLLQEMKKRERIIELEVQKATSELNHSLENEKTLLKELHHRTKNNLQLILSLVRLQSDKLESKDKSAFIQLESRINAIAKAQQLLYLSRDLKVIDMHEYISELCSSLEQLSRKDIHCEIAIDAVYIPIKEASPVGLIVNELVTNSIQHIKLDKIDIKVIVLKKDDEVTLIYKDNSKGFDIKKLDGDTLGIQLIKTLAEDQLEGELQIKSNKHLEYIVRFSL